jgi:hypothetical protein
VLHCTALHSIVFEGVGEVGRGKRCNCVVFERLCAALRNVGLMLAWWTVLYCYVFRLGIVFKAENITIQYCPPGQHRFNIAERSTQTFKNHAIATS